MAESWFQRPDLHRWTWDSISGGVRTEIDYVLVGGRWSLVQNCRVVWSAEFAGNVRNVSAKLTISTILKTLD